MKPKGLSGFTISKNCRSLDYCLIECIESMLPVCDEVVVGEMGSTDGTREILDAWMVTEPKLRVVTIRDWTLERANHSWFTSALNETREHLDYCQGLQLDSDEVLSDGNETIAAIKRACNKTNAIALDRLNFVRDATSLIPEGECVGKYVVRCGPSHLWWPSDEHHERGEVHLLDMSHIEPTARIFHLGFLRKPEAFYAKAKVVLGAFFGNYDQRLADAEKIGANPMSGMPWYNRLASYDGHYPDSVRKWMTERGYVVPLPAVHEPLAPTNESTA